MTHNKRMISSIRAGAICGPEGLRRGGFRIALESGRFGAVERSIPYGEWASCVALPGLIQSHLHLGQTLFRGSAEGRTLLPWLEERIWPMEASHDEDTLAVSVILSLRELFSSGCTGLLDMGTLELSGVTVDLLRRSGARAMAGNALMDRGPDWTRRDLGWLREESRRVSLACGGLVTYVHAPRFALSCSDELWSWMREIPAGHKRTTHAAESPDEMENASIRECGGNVRFLRDRGFTGPDTLLAHCVHLQDGELGILADSGSTVVHCPWTNLKLGSGIADVPSMAAAGITVLLGSDGAACNNRLDAAGEARLASALSAVSGVPSTFTGSYWMRSLTSIAARTMGWRDTGSIEPGNSADMSLLELSQEEWDELELAEDPLSYLLELDWASRTRLTMVAGRTVFADGEYPTLPPLPVTVGEARRRVLDGAAELTGSDPRTSGTTTDG